MHMASGATGVQALSTTDQSILFGSTIWNAVIAGGAGTTGSISHTAGTSGHPGQVTIATGAGNGTLIQFTHCGQGWAAASPLGTHPQQILFEDIESVVVWCQVPTLTTCVFRIGMWDGRGAQNGFGFTMDTSVDALLRAQNANAATPTSTTMTAISTLSKYEMRVNAAANQIDFYIDNVLVATHTSNLPTGVALSPYILIGNRSGVVRSMLVDIFDMLSQPLSR